MSAILGNSDQFTIAIRYQDKANYTKEENKRFMKKVSNNVTYLRIQDVYEFHKPYLQKLFTQYQIYNELYKSQLEKEFPKLFIEIDKFLNIVTPEENYKDVILSKMVSKLLRMK
ncbi:hypothetical protein KEH51_23455 [[Brevibacterium] frigoritolerans]|uniref:Uncharacterized protein n=1 Tax=Peribacillus frigoritolerans TaxID=450367 RepID=A0A941JBK9_9BACI|nr:hypothetical protein [Peribacillus frigoritolerans]